MRPVLLGLLCLSLAHPNAKAQGSAPEETTIEPATPAAKADDGYLKRLVDALSSDDSFKVRLQAAVLLGRTGDARAVESLLKALAEDPHYTVRASAATALANLGEPRAVSHILRALATDPESFVREECSRALGKYGRDDVLEYVQVAYGSEDPTVRREVLRYLAQNGVAGAEATLERALGDVPENFEIAKAIVMAMAGTDRMRFLERAVEHREPEVRRGAVRLLQDLASKEATLVILKVYDRDIEVDEVRDATRAALRSLRVNLDMNQVVQDAMSAADKHTRAKSLKLLGVLGGPDAERALLKALEDEDIYLRGTAVMAMRELGDPKVVPSLERLVDDPANQRIAHLVKHTLKQLRKQQGK